MYYKLINTLFLFLICGGSLYGQAVVGLSGGAYFYKFAPSHNASGDIQFSEKPAFCISASLKGRSGKSVNLGGTVSYVRKSFNATMSGGDPGLTYTRYTHFTLNYLYLSLFPAFTSEGNFRFNFNIGPSVGLLVQSSLNGVREEVSVIGVEYKQEKGGTTSDFSPYDIRFFAEWGFEVPVSENAKITFDNLYSLSIFNRIPGNKRYFNSRDIGIKVGLLWELKNFRPLKHFRRAY